MIVMSDQDVFCFDVAVHEIVVVQVFDCLADIAEVLLNKLFVELSVPEFDLLVE